MCGFISQILSINSHHKTVVSLYFRYDENTFWSYQSCNVDFQHCTTITALISIAQWSRCADTRTDTSGQSMKKANNEPNIAGHTLIYGERNNNEESLQQNEKKHTGQFKV